MPIEELGVAFAPSEGNGTGRGRAGFLGLYDPLEPALDGPPGFNLGRPGPLRTPGVTGLELFDEPSENEQGPIDVCIDENEAASRPWESVEMSQ